MTVVKCPRCGRGLSAKYRLADFHFRRVRRTGPRKVRRRSATSALLSRLICDFSPTGAVRP